MIGLVLRKLASNAWKAACLLVGGLLVVGMVCSIPIYSDGILQRLLTRDLENAQSASGRYPGTIGLVQTFLYFGDSTSPPDLGALENVLAKATAAMPRAPLLAEETLEIGLLYWEPDREAKKTASLSISSTTDLASRVRIVRGRMYDPAASGGAIETVASQADLDALEMTLDKDYEIRSYRQGKGEAPLLTVRVVGVYVPAEGSDLSWYRISTLMDDPLLLADPTYVRAAGTGTPDLRVSKQTVHAAFDIHAFRIQDVGALRAAYDLLLDEDAKPGSSFTLDLPADAVIRTYVGRAEELRLLLQILVVPVLFMLVFYLFMVSQLTVRGEAATISVLESRGAGRGRILGMYALEASLLGGAALAAGPPLGVAMVQVIGASNGFLEFIGRKRLPILLTATDIGYAVAAVLLMLAATLLPAWLQSRISIVETKRRSSRRPRGPLWERLFLDLVLLAVGLYALQRLRAEQAARAESLVAGASGNLDGLLFLASTVFLLGAGLLFLRLYPYALRLLYAAGRRLWNPVLYATFHRLIRTDGQERFLMLFLVLALSVGLFDANAARTLNRDMEDATRISLGADLVLQERWIRYDENGNPVPEAATSPTMDSTATVETHYLEPPFGRFRALPGVASAARVFRTKRVSLQRGSAKAQPALMAVDPYDFGRTAWTRSDLNGYSLNEAMNALMAMPDAILASSDLRDSLGLSVGDAISYTVEGATVDGVVVAFLDHWPGWTPATAGADGKLIRTPLLVAHLEHLRTSIPALPYEVWLRRADGATDRTVYDGISAAGIQVDSIASSNQRIVAARNDPKLQGTNGALTLGFLVSMLVCAIGFLIYWILSVQGRVLQFGVYRAMGLGKGAVVAMLLGEQVLVSGASIAAGVLLGNLASALYVPLFSLASDPATRAIPFRVVASSADAVRIYAVLGVLLLVGFAVLARLVLRIRAAQAVKLGEE